MLISVLSGVGRVRSSNLKLVVKMLRSKILMRLDWAAVIGAALAKSQRGGGGEEKGKGKGQEDRLY